MVFGKTNCRDFGRCQGYDSKMKPCLSGGSTVTTLYFCLLGSRQVIPVLPGYIQLESPMTVVEDNRIEVSVFVP